jgi:hypothetical protein
MPLQIVTKELLMDLELCFLMSGIQILLKKINQSDKNHRCILVLSLGQLFWLLLLLLERLDLELF